MIHGHLLHLTVICITYNFVLFLIFSLPLIFSIEEVLLAAVHVPAVEAVVHRVVALGAHRPLDDLQVTDLSEVRVGHGEVGHVLEVQDTDGGGHVDVVEDHGTLSASWFPEEHLELQVC